MTLRTRSARALTGLAAGALIVFAAACAPCFAAEVTVGILPFFVHSQDPLEPLGQAIPDMLASRLETPGDIRTLSRAAVRRTLRRLSWQTYDEQRARAIGEALGADVVIAGTLTKIGDTVSLDTVVIRVGDPDKIRRIYYTAEDIESLPEKLRDLARRLSFAVLDQTIVASIAVEGNRFIGKDAIVHVMKTRPGEPFSPELLQEDLRRIYQMGYFQDIRIESRDTDDGGGKDILLHIKEQPMIRAVQIVGNKKVKLEDIQKVMEAKPRTILDVSRIKGDVARIRKVYVDKGFYNAGIDYAIKPIDDLFTSVDFTIKEDAAVKVRAVTFSGNEYIPARELRKVMETRPRHWLLSVFTSRGVFRDDGMEKDVDRITAYYYSKGFLQVRVKSPEVSFRDDGIYAHIEIIEGDRYTVGAIEFSGDLIHDTGQLRSAIKSSTDQTFNGRLLNEDLIAIKALYSREGFAFADITPLTDIQPEDRKVNLVFDIAKGEKIYVQEIRVTGNTRTRDNVIRREMRVTEGAVYDSAELDRSKQEINNLGFFESVNVNTEPGTESDLVKLHIDVKERATGTFSIGAGYSSYDSVMGMFQISQNNLFGKGQQLQLMAQLGGRSTYYNISFTEPWFRDTRMSVGFDLFRIEREYREFDRDSSGFNLRAGWPLDAYYDFTRFYLTYRYEKIDIKIVDWYRGVSLDIQNQQGSNSVSSVIGSVVKDSRDDRFKPRSGERHSVSLEVAGPGGDSRFMTFMLSLGKWFPLPWETAFAVRGHYGQIVPYAGRGVPISEKFFLGGIDSLRAFEMRSVGPRKPRPKRRDVRYFAGRTYEYQSSGFTEKYDVVGGKKELYFNFEYLFPLLKQAGIRGLFFYDIGNAYGSGETLFSDLRHGLGMGISWYSPFGPLQVVWGYNLSREYDERSSNFEFSMGGLF